MTDDFGPEPDELQHQVAEAIEEVKEEFSLAQAQQSQDRLWLNQIGLSTGILSALAAIAAMQAGYLANEGTLAQIRANDQWDYYQAKSTKLHIEQSTVTILQSLHQPVPPSITAEITKLNQQLPNSQNLARSLETEGKLDLHRHEFFSYSVAALQIAISLGAVAALLRKKAVWYLGLGIGALGFGLMIFGACSQPNLSTHPDSESASNERLVQAWSQYGSINRRHPHNLTSSRQLELALCSQRPIEQALVRRGLSERLPHQEH
jgi:hypothetical protein